MLESACWSPPSAKCVSAVSCEKSALPLATRVPFRYTLTAPAWTVTAMWLHTPAGTTPALPGASTELIWMYSLSALGPGIRSTSAAALLRKFRMREPLAFFPPPSGRTCMLMDQVLERMRAGIDASTAFRK